MTAHHISRYPVDTDRHAANIPQYSERGVRKEIVMNSTGRTYSDKHDPGLYEIRVSGHLSDLWAGWFEDLDITLDEQGDTILIGLVADQAALYGLLRKVRDIGLPLLSLNRLPYDEVDAEPACETDKIF